MAHRIICRRDLDTLVPHPWLTNALPPIVTVTQALLSQRPTNAAAANRGAAKLDAALLKHLKLLCTVVQAHPWALHAAGALPTALTVMCDIGTRRGGTGRSWSNIVAKAMAFASHVFTSPAYLVKKHAVTLVTPVRFAHFSCCCFFPVRHARPSFPCSSVLAAIPVDTTSAVPHHSMTF